MQKEKTIDVNEEKMLFWKQFKKTYEYINDKCGVIASLEVEIFNHLLGHNLIHSNIEKGLSWERFKQEILRLIDIPAEIFEFDRNKILRFCY